MACRRLSAEACLPGVYLCGNRCVEIVVPVRQIKSLRPSDSDEQIGTQRPKKKQWPDKELACCKDSSKQPAAPIANGFLFGTASKRTKESYNAVKGILPSRTCNNRMQAATRVIAALRPLQALATKGKLLLLQALAHRLVSIHAVQR